MIGPFSGEYRWLSNFWPEPAWTEFETSKINDFNNLVPGDSNE